MEDQKLEPKFKTIHRYEEVEQKELRVVTVKWHSNMPRHLVFNITAGEPTLPIKAHGVFNDFRWAVDSADKLWMDSQCCDDSYLIISPPERLLNLLSGVDRESESSMKSAAKIQSALGIKPSFGPCPCCNKWGKTNEMEYILDNGEFVKK
jgi:hypothetical protein